MDRGVMVVVVLGLLAAQCGKRVGEDSQEMLGRRADGIAKVAEVARAFRDEVREEDEEREPKRFPLDGVLPSPLPGWWTKGEGGDSASRGGEEGGALPEAHRTYRSGTMEVVIKIVDVEREPVKRPAWATNEGNSREGGKIDVYQRNDKEWPRFESFSPESMAGSVEVIVDDRFLVVFEGRGLRDGKALHSYLEHTELERLSPSCSTAAIFP